MTPPTEEERLASLGELAGNPGASLPDAALDRALLTLKLITEAKQRGISWAILAHSQGYPNGPACKASVKRLARWVQAELLKKEIREAIDA